MLSLSNKVVCSLCVSLCIDGIVVRVNHGHIEASCTGIDRKRLWSTSRKTKNTRDGWLVGESKTLNVCVWMICAFHDFLYFICVYLLYDQININRYFVDFIDVVFLAVYSQKGHFWLCWYQKVFGWLVG